ncbi:hypothetical protein Ahu01nite_086090 [Winogradskya humida]|uniref:non-specific serine/threonine protein kinase n=1 Tax=Winogradskya humida TaxID=113566 RepID=A0ABQ4A576_9ACTN|nr:hypothetical protein Ahu01nite_086090 [Actinoplanes humidus]
MPSTVRDFPHDGADTESNRGGSTAATGGSRVRTLAGRYRVEEAVGRGGSAVVHRGWDRTLKRRVAIKLFSSYRAEGNEPSIDVLREARTAAGLNHPNVARVYDYGEALEGTERVPYLVMEFLDGDTLADELARTGALDWHRAAEICAATAAALAAAHERNLVHRDVKPRNVMLTPTGVKVVDFGIAAVAGQNSVDTHGRLWGTPASLAPEQLRGEPTFPAADVYGLGLLLFECLAGTPAWPGQTVGEILALRHDQRTPRLPRIPGLPRDIIRLYEACTSEDPARRPTAAHAAETLRRTAGLMPTVRPAIAGSVLLPGTRSQRSRPGSTVGAGTGLGGATARSARTGLSGATASRSASGPGGAAASRSGSGPGGAAAPRSGSGPGGAAAPRSGTGLGGAAAPRSGTGLGGAAAPRSGSSPGGAAAREFVVAGAGATAGSPALGYPASGYPASGSRSRSRRREAIMASVAVAAAVVSIFGLQLVNGASTPGGRQAEAAAAGGAGIPAVAPTPHPHTAAPSPSAAPSSATPTTTGATDWRPIKDPVETTRATTSPAAPSTTPTKAPHTPPRTSPAKTPSATPTTPGHTPTSSPTATPKPSPPIPTPTTSPTPTDEPTNTPEPSTDPVDPPATTHSAVPVSSTTD